MVRTDLVRIASRYYAVHFLHETFTTATHIYAAICPTFFLLARLPAHLYHMLFCTIYIYIICMYLPIHICLCACLYFFCVFTLYACSFMYYILYIYMLCMYVYVCTYSSSFYAIPWHVTLSCTFLLHLPFTACLAYCTHIFTLCCPDHACLPYIHTHAACHLPLPVPVHVCLCMCISIILYATTCLPFCHLCLPTLPPYHVPSGEGSGGLALGCGIEHDRDRLLHGSVR